jgi:Domain of unknown function DUF11
MRRRPFGPESAGATVRRKSASRLRIEMLEDRRLLTTLFVTNVNDNGPGSLRQAILDSNSGAGSDVIDFNINGSGVHTISLTTTPLPTIQDTVLIDGTTQPSNGGTTVTTPLIQLDGSTLPAGTNDGLAINMAVGTSPTTIRGLAISGFSGSGISIAGAGGNSVQESLIGTTADGTAAATVPNGNGITINGSPNNSIGGTQTTFRNVISGNSGNGVFITGAGASGNSVQGNEIGTDVGGTIAIPNNIGVQVNGASNNSIGGAIAAARNVISGNLASGIQITGTGGSNNSVQGNYIGVNASGNGAVANDVGVQIDGAATSNSIGGAAVANRNVISGNRTSNIHILGSTNNVIVGNTVGLNSDGTVAINLTQASTAGIEVEDGATGNTIGGIAATASNVVSGSAGPNIQIKGKSSSTVTATAANNLIQGNFVGTNLSGTTAVTTTTGGGGIVLRDGTTGNTIGGVSSGLARNLVSGNIGNGVALLGAGTTGNVLQGNDIGTQVDGATALANTGAGVFVDGAINNTIGGSASGAANTIADNGGAGVFVNTGTGIAIQQNSIFGNTGLGIDLAPAGVNPNQPANPATGPNNLQNYPVLTSVTTANGVSTVVGTLLSAPSKTFTIEFFSNVAADVTATNHGPGHTFVGSTSVTTDANGNATFTAATTTPVTLNAILSATATDGTGDTSEFAANLTNTAPTADLALTLTAAPEPVAVGGIITYTITVKNNGPSNATNVVATNTLPAGVSFVGATSSVGSIAQSGTTVTATLGALASGVTDTITITVVTTAVGSLTDTASLALTENDPALANNTASVVSTVVQGVDLVVTTSVSPAVTAVGTPSTITYTITNAATSTANSVSLLAPLSSSATVVSSSSSQGSTSTTGGTLTAAIGTLAAGASATVTVTLNPTVTGTILTTGTASSNVPDVNPGNNSATATITVGTTPVTPVTDGPRVLGVDRAGFHSAVTRITLTFDSTLTAATATNLSNYKLVAIRRGRKAGTTREVTLKLRSAFYDNTAKTVTLKTSKPLSLHQLVQLTAIGTAPNGITGTSGALLDGADDGSPGSDFVTTFTGVGPGRISVTAFDAAIASLGQKRHR